MERTFAFKKKRQKEGAGREGAQIAFSFYFAMSHYRGSTHPEQHHQAPSLRTTLSTSV